MIGVRARLGSQSPRYNKLPSALGACRLPLRPLISAMPLTRLAPVLDKNAHGEHIFAHEDGLRAH